MSATEITTSTPIVPVIATPIGPATITTMPLMPTTTTPMASITTTLLVPTTTTSLAPTITTPLTSTSTTTTPLTSTSTMTTPLISTNNNISGYASMDAPAWNTLRNNVRDTIIIPAIKKDIITNTNSRYCWETVAKTAAVSEYIFHTGTLLTSALAGYFSDTRLSIVAVGTSLGVLISKAFITFAETWSNNSTQSLNNTLSSLKIDPLPTYSDVITSDSIS